MDRVANHAVEPAGQPGLTGLGPLADDAPVLQGEQRTQDRADSPSQFECNDAKCDESSDATPP